MADPRNPSSGETDVEFYMGGRAGLVIHRSDCSTGLNGTWWLPWEPSRGMNLAEVRLLISRRLATTAHEACMKPRGSHDTHDNLATDEHVWSDRDGGCLRTVEGVRCPKFKRRQKVA